MTCQLFRTRTFGEWPKEGIPALLPRQWHPVAQLLRAKQADRRAFLFEIPGKCCERHRVVASAERLNEHSLEDCLGRQRATATYIVGGWVYHGFSSQELAALTVGLG
jgi:hypothetical protein